MCQEFNQLEHCDLIGAATIVVVEQVVYRQLTRPFSGWALILQVIIPCTKKVVWRLLTITCLHIKTAVVTKTHVTPICLGAQLQQLNYCMIIMLIIQVADFA